MLISFHGDNEYLLLVFGFHDRTKFEIFCYALSSSDGSIWRKKIEAEVENFRDISALHSGEAAQVMNRQIIQ
jgi:protein O-GlcNAc transferase